MGIRTTFSGSGMIARHEQAEKELQEKVSQVNEALNETLQNGFKEMAQLCEKCYVNESEEFDPCFGSEEY